MTSGFLTWTGDGDGGGISMWLALLMLALPLLLGFAGLFAIIRFFVIVLVESFVKNPFRSSLPHKDTRAWHVTDEL